MDGEAERWAGRSVGDERYALGRVLGEGSQGATFEAVDKRSGTPVAIKRFAVRGARSWKDVELAEREADVLAGLSHPLVPAVLDRFEEDGALWLVMELVPGRSLAEAPLRDREEIVAFIEDCAEIFDYLHGRSPPVIHRDVKPGNVIRRPAAADDARDRFVLVDFGSVRQRLETKGGSTVVGTFGYMAPEQLQGRALPATDVYGVGATALTMATGVEPEDLPHVGLGVDVAAALPGDPALAELLEPMLRPDPDARASRLAPLLTAWRALHGAPPPPGPPQDRPPPRRDHDRDRGRSDPPADQPSRRPPPLLLALVGLVVVVATSVARVVGNVLLRVVLPVLLRVAATLVGPKAERAAVRVDRLGGRFDRFVVRLQGALLGTERAATPTEPPEAPGAGVRIDDASVPPGGARIDPDVVDEATAEVEAAVEQMVDEIQGHLERREKKRRRR